MLILQQVAYAHPDRSILFTDISVAINGCDKIALIGNNGAGKSTLLQLMAGIIAPTSGVINRDSKPYYVPQHFGQYDDLTVSQALKVDKKIEALHQILAGNVTDANMTDLDDDWTIEERCSEALNHWQLPDIALSTPISNLSGGQKTKVFLSGLMIHDPQMVLLDEPSNHLDTAARELLYDYIRTAAATLVIVSHDRTLLDLPDTTIELSTKGIAVYGGNYTFYKEQKAIAQQAFSEAIRDNEKTLRKAKAVERETMERQQKLDARGKKMQEKAGIPTIMMNTFRNNAEKSTARIRDMHASKVGDLSEKIAGMRKELPEKDKIRLGLGNSELHNGRILIKADRVNFAYGQKMLWAQPLSFTVVSGARIGIKGGNGSGKTTLIKLMLGELQPAIGFLLSNGVTSVFIDQDYSLINNERTVYEQAQHYNTDHLEEHEVKSRLTHYLFTREYWDKPCCALSGGERMRLMLCCITLSEQSPDIIVLDEPVNNLDIQNVEILTDAISAYKGTVILVSHDLLFLQQTGVKEFILL